MRGMFKRELAEEESKPSRPQSFEYWVQTEGHRAAAWLIQKHRASIHRSGAVQFNFDVPKGNKSVVHAKGPIVRIGPRPNEVPPWFRVAIEALRRRPKSWTVTVRGKPTDKKRSWTVRWLGWKGPFPVGGESAVS